MLGSWPLTEFEFMAVMKAAWWQGYCRKPETFKALVTRWVGLAFLGVHDLCARH